ncbi:hypothetical protein NX059_008152 [Plenodomus lindquistii]|nr:hypothetical protein NX059_008152 [Plenodomus lindquistii]
MVLPMVGLQDSLTSTKRKVTVMLAFSTRSPNMVFAIMHLTAYSRFIISNQSAISIVLTAAWQSVLLSYNLMSATSPLLKGFTEGFTTAGTSLGYVQEGVTTGGGSAISGSYELRSLTRAKSRLKISPSDAADSELRNAQVQWNTKPNSKALETTSKDDLRHYHESASITSHDSRRIMIKREWKVSEE